ncbi:hypothetical protein BFW38_01485 [Terasakiispira papahanaumokuakeensis]|uniref:ProQ/FinO domain-containing protein n=1 Tax=Terasakiispira papahanaumokuakeensis TaxID=197479 RepID=A0A1E2V5X2_9GAMM|nr:ProQ/FINO family protein [Terasakiispira papahanaumokuakeensis]ODC02408.1 hypothetical protein BFW38_01485 [Terasakiispira papahanaumokuakeensis]
MSQSNTALGLDQAFEQLAQHIDQTMGVLVATQADNQQLREQLAEQSVSLQATQAQAWEMKAQAQGLVTQLTDCHKRLARVLAQPEDQTLDALLQQLEARFDGFSGSEPEAAAVAVSAEPLVSAESVASAEDVGPNLNEKVLTDDQPGQEEGPPDKAIDQALSEQKIAVGQGVGDQGMDDQEDTTSSQGESDNKLHPKEVLRSWCQRYPNTFMLEQPQPLQIGLHETLAEIDQLDIKLVRRALAHYVKTPRYLRCLRTGAVRLDLQGHNAGFVTAEEAQHAQDELKALDKKRKDREKERQERQLQDKLTQLVNRY